MANTNCLEGWRCPTCGNEAQFKVVAEVLAVVTDNGVESMTEPEWEDNSLVTCMGCQRHGTVDDFYTFSEVGYTKTINLGECILRFTYVGIMSEGVHVWRVKLNYQDAWLAKLNQDDHVAKRGSILTTSSNPNEVVGVFLDLLNRWADSGRTEDDPADLVLFDDDWKPVLAYRTELRRLA